MSEQISELELKDRLNLIETMIAEGRRRTERWGWTFVLWGVAYYVAIFWSSWSVHPWSLPETLFDGNPWAWPVTMLSTCAITIAIGINMGRKSQHPNTAMGRAISSIWGTMGVSMVLLFPTLSMVGKIDHHSFVALIAAFLGMANGSCGLILKWRAQLLCAVVWWTTTVLACFGSEAQLVTVFLTALFLCQIVFGVYAMSCEARALRGTRHA